jgi:hypothetical protein
LTSLNIDLRDKCLRILVAKDGTPKYSKLIKDFPHDDETSATERLASAIKEAGGKKARVNVILPTDIMNYKTYKTPSLEIEDARKVIRRELAKELEGQDFSFSIKSIMKRTSAGQQEMLAEYVLEADVMKYLNVLRACRIRPDIMSSSLEGNTRLFNKQRPETDGNEALIDIGMNVIEVAVFKNRNLLMYDRLSMQHAHDERPEDKDASFEQQDKMKTFKIVETLYQFIMRYSKDFPEEKLSLLWLCGLGALAEGITDSLSDGLGVEARLISPFDTEIEQGSALSTLAGIATVSKDEQFINLLPRDIFEKRSRLLKRVLLAASLSFYIILLAGGTTVLSVLEKDLKQTHEKIMADQALLAGKQQADTLYSSNQGTYIKLVSGGTSLYSVFRDIANLTPSGVVLDGIDIENVNGKINLKISATINYSDENFKHAVLSTFLTSLDSSSRLKQILPPEISVKKTSDEQKEISVVANYEILQ